MIEWISKAQRNKRIKEEQERALRKSLAEKLSRLKADDVVEFDDHTEFMFNGRVISVAKEEIVITGVHPKSDSPAEIT
jgi:hypothetical protein